MRLGLVTTLLFAATVPAGASGLNFTTLSDPNATQGTTAIGINNAGTIVGEYYRVSFAAPTNFVYVNGSFGELLALAGIPGLSASSTWAVNNSGEYVGWYQQGSNPEQGFLDDRGILTTISSPSSTFASLEAHGINDSGTIVGDVINPTTSSHEGFIDTNGTISLISYPGARSTHAVGINDAGDVTGGYTDSSGDHGFLYKNGVFTSINVPGALGTFAYGINSTGEIVGLYETSTCFQGFLDDNGGFTKFSYPGAACTNPVGINDAGDIVGDYYATADSNQEGFLATPSAATPEPASGVLLGIGLTALTFVRRRCR